MKLTESLLGSRIVNALGQRIQKIGAGQFTYNSSDILPPSTGLSARAVTLAYNARYVYDEQGRLLGEYSPEGKLIAETIWFDDLRVATLRPTGSSNQMPLGGEGIANNTGANDESDPVDVEIYYVHPDHLGTPRVVTRSVSKGKLGPSVANKAVWRWDSDPFGSSIGNSKPNENPQGVTGMASQVTAASFRVNNRFPGQLADAESGKHYNYFRDCDPSIGRYVESDPIGLLGSISTYGYVESGPIRYFDSDGLKRRVGRPGNLGGNAHDRRSCRRNCPEPVTPPESQTGEAYQQAADMFKSDWTDPWFTCLEWNCQKASCTPWDIRGPNDFLHAAYDPENPPEGCVCSRKLLIGSGPRPPSPGIGDFPWPRKKPKAMH